MGVVTSNLCGSVIASARKRAKSVRALDRLTGSGGLASVAAAQHRSGRDRGGSLPDAPASRAMARCCSALPLLPAVCSWAPRRRIWDASRRILTITGWVLPPCSTSMFWRKESHPVTRYQVDSRPALGERAWRKSQFLVIAVKSSGIAVPVGGGDGRQGLEPGEQAEEEPREAVLGACAGDLAIVSLECAAA